MPRYGGKVETDGMIPYILGTSVNLLGNPDIAVRSQHCFHSRCCKSARGQRNHGLQVVGILRHRHRYTVSKNGADASISGSQHPIACTQKLLTD